MCFSLFLLWYIYIIVSRISERYFSYKAVGTVAWLHRISLHKFQTFLVKCYRGAAVFQRRFISPLSDSECIDYKVALQPLLHCCSVWLPLRPCTQAPA